MEKSTFNRESTRLFTEISNRISYKQDSLLEYINQPFSKEAFANQIKSKSTQFTTEKRNTLVNSLKVAYKSVSTENKVIENINSLQQENTFTITTGHQLSLFTGPIYFIYKILHVIRLTEDLNKIYPENKFIPVFWMASEDHDFEEIQSVFLFNKTLKWETEQKGAVGRFEIDSLDPIIDDFKTFFLNHPESEVIDLLKSFQGKNLGKATFSLVNTLFKSFGLVIVDGDDLELKREFAPTMEKELKSQFSFNAVNRSSEKLKNENIKLQITPREYNLFYLGVNSRERIQPQSDGYFIEGKGIVSQEELLLNLKNDPSSFSPNVVLRPLYQETILPNLCYLGGGGEMAYWLQLKGVFNEIDCVFPLIQVRNSILQIDGSSLKKMNTIGLTVESIFKDIDELKKQYVLTNSSEELNFTNLDSSFTDFSSTLSKQIIQIDPNLHSFASSEIIRIEKQILSIKQKLIKTEKGKHEQILNQIEQIKNRLFPNGGMQERSMNFFSLCSDGQVTKHLEYIYNSIEPFGNDLIVLN